MGEPVIILRMKKHCITFENHDDFHAFVDAVIIFRDTVRKNDYLKYDMFTAETSFEYCTSLRGAFDEKSDN